MLDDLAVVVETEDVHSGVVVVSGPGLAAVQDYMVGVSERTDDFHMLAGIVGSHALEVVDERLLAVATSGLCWMYTSPAKRSMASRGWHLLNMRS